MPGLLTQTVSYVYYITLHPDSAPAAWRCHPLWAEDHTKGPVASSLPAFYGHFRPAARPPCAFEYRATAPSYHWLSYRPMPLHAQSTRLHRSPCSLELCCAVGSRVALYPKCHQEDLIYAFAGMPLQATML